MDRGAGRVAGMTRKAHPSDLPDDEWATVAPHLVLPEDAGQRAHALREGVQRAASSGHRAGYDGAKRKKNCKLHLTVDTLGHLLALHVTPATADDRSEVGRLAAALQEAAGGSVGLAFVDQGHVGERSAAAARERGIASEVVKLPEAKHGFVLLP